MHPYIEVYLRKTDGKQLSFIDQTQLTKSVVLAQTSSGYTVDYQPRMSGMYDIHVELRGEPIAGTPFKQEVIAGAINAKYTTIRGKAVQVDIRLTLG